MENLSHKSRQLASLTTICTRIIYTYRYLHFKLNVRILFLYAKYSIYIVRVYILIIMVVNCIKSGAEAGLTLQFSFTCETFYRSYNLESFPAYSNFLYEFLKDEKGLIAYIFRGKTYFYIGTLY